MHLPSILALLRSRRTHLLGLLVITTGVTAMQAFSNANAESKGKTMAQRTSSDNHLRSDAQASAKTLHSGAIASQSSKITPQNQPSPQSKKTPEPLSKPAARAEKIEIRVLLLEAPSVEIASSTTAEIQTSNQAPLNTISATTNYTVSSKPNSIQVGNQSLPNAIWVDPVNPNEAVYVNGTGYEGKLLIVNLGDRLLIVNQVELETYIASVTGSEMYSNWPTEALKAQAVAARSYALTHYQSPMSDYFDLCSNEDCQMYKGMIGESESTQMAAIETQNQILINPDQSPYLAQYSATEKITNSAHYGHGMPQEDAEKLAKEGWTYKAILAKYYPQATLAVVSP